MILTDLDAFYWEHRRCGELDDGPARAEREMSDPAARSIYNGGTRPCLHELPGSYLTRLCREIGRGGHGRPAQGYDRTTSPDVLRRRGRWSKEGKLPLPARDNPQRVHI